MEIISEAELELPINDRLLYNEMRWFASTLKETRPSVTVIEVTCFVENDTIYVLSRCFYDA